MNKILLLAVFCLSFQVFAEHEESSKNPEPRIASPAEVVLTQDQLRDEFLDSCKIECAEIKYSATCSVFIKGSGKIEKKGDNRCLAFKAICEVVKEKKLNPRKASKFACTHP